MKTCRTCSVSKPLTEFSKGRVCKPCQNTAQRETRKRKPPPDEQQRNAVLGHLWGPELEDKFTEIFG